VDRLSTGRRHVRAGSVSVTELISKQARRPESPAPITVAVRAPAFTPVESPTEPFAKTPAKPPADPRPGRPDDVGSAAIEPLPATRVSHRRPPSRGAQVAKMTSLGVATIVLCGAVGVATMIAQQRRAETPTDRPAAAITGEQALLPDELNRTLPVPGVAPAASPTKPTPVATPSKTAGVAERPASPTRTSTPAPKKDASSSDAELVLEFYRLLPNDPGGAFDLISPSLLHSTLGRFLESWSLVRSVDVLSVAEQADGVLAVVRMRLADGSHLQLQQLLTVADSPRRIATVQLLSAQRN
jgi:hypothetical protein